MRSRQRGAALVELAFVLPILLALLVGMIYYGYVLVLQMAVTGAAREGAQVAMAVDSVGLSPDAYRSAVAAEAGQAARNSLAWLPEAVAANLEDPEVTFPAGNRVRVEVTLPTSGGGGGLLPQANIPLVGPIPPLPADLVGVADVGM